MNRIDAAYRQTQPTLWSVAFARAMGERTTR
jgi:hypothetical protein